MNRSRLLFLVVSGTIVLSILSGSLLGATARKGDQDSFYKYLSVFTDVLRLVEQAYVEETDVSLLMEGALDGAPDALDPFSMYVPEGGESGYLEAREIDIRHSGMRVVKERGVAYVVAVQQGTPADELGIVRGDIVTRIDGASTREMPLWKIEEAFASPAGTRLELELLRGGESRDMVLELAPFEAPGPTLEEVEGTPLLRIPDFADGTREKVADLLATVSGDQLLIDLRGVAWGDVERAFEVGALFADGELGSLVNRDGVVESFEFPVERAWSGRAVVLVDRGCQGASEVLAKVLRHGADAELVGQTTFGFAGRSRVVDLRAGGSLVITEAFYAGPDGEPLNRGVEPDLVVGDRSRSFNELTESLEDLTLHRALDLLRGDGEPVREAA
ncbi:MAG: S41 family peptidase [Thermoanaerobaculia bacterium]|nr:S41 family peptidase [Thermoanaerobaculia bacterium]